MQGAILSPDGPAVQLRRYGSLSCLFGAWLQRSLRTLRDAFRRLERLQWALVVSDKSRSVN